MSSIQTFRTMVSRVYRLSMLIAANQHTKAADEFDELTSLMAQMLSSGEMSTSDIEIANQLIQNDSSVLVEDGPTLIVHDENKTVVLTPGKQGTTTNTIVHVEKVEEDKEIEAEEAEVETEEAEEAEVETEEAEEAEVETEEAEEAEVETEEAEEAEVETEEAEEAEVETEEAEEAEVETEEAEEAEVETEEAEEEVEEVEVESEEAEEEEGSLEPIRIGKKMYFIDATTQNVFAYVSDEEAGDHVGQLVNGKLVPV